jgi:hypothetical protein
VAERPQVRSPADAKVHGTLTPRLPDPSIWNVKSDGGGRLETFAAASGIPAKKGDHCACNGESRRAPSMKPDPIFSRDLFLCNNMLPAPIPRLSLAAGKPFDMIITIPIAGGFF